MKNLLFLCSLLLFSCSKDNNGSQSTSIDTGIKIYLKDANGNNLLDTPNYKEKTIKVLYLINNEVKEFFEPHLDNPRAFRFIIDERPLPLRMGLGPNTTETEEFPITYIQWNETDTDTVKCHFRRANGKDGTLIQCDKIWYNNKFVWDMSNPEDRDDRSITIIK